MAASFIPRHRRPSRISHRADLEAVYRKKTPLMPPDSDTFYYNEAFTGEWIMPDDLLARLPSQLVDEVKTWQAAGAAVLTDLARYDNLEREAIIRGWPEQRNSHLSRTTSCASPAMLSPTSPVLPSPQGGFPLTMPKLPRRARKDSSMPAIADTPPFTPQDSGFGDQFITEAALGPTIHNEADLHRINSRLTTLSLRDADHKHTEPSPVTTPGSRRSSNGSQNLAQPAFDEAAWDVFINACKAELDHLRQETLVRFRHLGRGIDRLWQDLNSDSSQRIQVSASVEFVQWWKHMTEKAQQCEDEAKALELPDLEEVKMEREAQGLPFCASVL